MYIKFLFFLPRHIRGQYGQCSVLFSSLLFLLSNDNRRSSKLTFVFREDFIWKSILIDLSMATKLLWLWLLLLLLLLLLLWVRICALRWSERANVLSHEVHLNLRSPVCNFEWRLRLRRCLKPLPNQINWNVFFSSA